MNNTVSLEKIYISPVCDPRKQCRAGLRCSYFVTPTEDVSVEVEEEER